MSSQTRLRPMARSKPTTITSARLPRPSTCVGTDSLGRDVLSRIIHGTRVSLWVAVMAVAISKAIGFAWGVLTGYLGGKFDLISQRFLDVLISFPGVILALLLLVALGTGMTTVIVAIATTGIAGTTRIIRSVTLSVRETFFVEAARAIGASPLRIMVYHVAPSVYRASVGVGERQPRGGYLCRGRPQFSGHGYTTPSTQLGQHIRWNACTELLASLVAGIIPRGWLSRSPFSL